MTARLVIVVLAMAALGACATLPPGSDFPKVASVALASPDETRLGRQFATAASEHDGRSGFRILTIGVDGLLVRAQMIDAAERTLDLQYFIFRGDETGWLLTDALLRAADRGVRVRVLVDDGATIAGDEQILALDAHPAIEIRIFNPFAYRGHANLARAVEYLFNHGRLNYRMHNKLIVSDNAVALIGGRNIGNEYFQIDSESQFADDDVFVAGPITRQLSTTFDVFWNSAFAIPSEALKGGKQRTAALEKRRAATGTAPSAVPLKTGGTDYVSRIATGEPYAGMIDGRLPLVWAPARVVADSPDKKNVASGARRGRLMLGPVADTARTVQTEFLMVTPYFIPADEELKLVTDMRKRGATVRVLTNSLESNPETVAHAGYMRYRAPLIEAGVELYEIRSLLGNARGSGQTSKLSRYGNYSLHAKLFVFDRRQLFVGSMNFDQRSKRLNTEIGLIIDSPSLAEQTVGRFVAMVQPENAYHVVLLPGSAGGGPHLAWQTVEDGKAVEYKSEPARSGWQKLKADFYSILPIDSEL